jgi:hypothetical protein
MFNETETMTCQYCDTDSHIYTASCDGCKVRGLYKSPDFVTAKRLGFVTKQIESALQNMFGAEWEKKLPEVKNRMKAGN